MRSRYKLTAAQVGKGRLAQGRYSYGGNLYLLVSDTGAKSWVVRIKFDGKERDIGVGSAIDVTLASAREEADRIRAMVAKGLDPRVKDEAELTFEQAARQCLASIRSGWKNDRLGKRWEQILGEDYAKPLNAKLVKTVDVADVEAALKPVWNADNLLSTGKFYRGMIERTLDWAATKGHRDRSLRNPAAWRETLRHTMAKPKRGTNWGALPYANVPTFYATLGERPATSARVLQMLILTACRKNEIVEARWGEVDFKACTLTIPASRMKKGKEHVVPLTKPALAILEAQAAKKSNITDLIFPSDAIPTQPYEGSNINRHVPKPYTPHGFRSAFRDWAGDKTEHPRDIAEMCLAHAVGDQTERAYRRSNALERRAALMSDWAAFVTQSTSNESSAEAPQPVAA